jgi:hypothetical protein
VYDATMLYGRIDSHACPERIVQRSVSSSS